MATVKSVQASKPQKKMNKMPVATFVQISVLIWSATILTAGWVGVIKHADNTFTAGIFTSILSNFGIHAVNRKKEEEENEPTKKPAPKKAETVPTPTSSTPTPTAPSTSVIRSSKSSSAS
jgi:hypothetical protein